MVKRLREGYINESALFVIKKDGKYVKDMTDGSGFTKSYQQAEKYTNKKSAQEAARDYARRYGKGYSVFNVFGNNKTGATNESRSRRTFVKKHFRNMSESPLYTITDRSYYAEIAEEVAQYMGYSVDEAYSELESDPQSIIDYLEDEEDYYNNRGLIRKIEKYFM